MTTRTYTSPLREEQMQQTRDRILEKVLEIMATGDVELTVAEAATRARVSVRTAYRYFPTKEALLDAFNAWTSNRLGFVAMPKSLDEIVEYAATLCRTFSANEALLRASQRTLAADEVRQRRKLQQARAVTKLVDDAVPSVEPAVRRHAAAALLTALGFDTWVQLREIWNLDAEGCVAQAQFTVTAVIAQLHKAAKRR